MDPQLPGSSGLLGSLRSFADGFLGSVHDRIELFSVELQEEKQRLVQTFLWASAVVLLAMLTLTFASFAVIVLFWDTAKVAVVITLAVAYAVALAAAVFGLMHQLKRHSKPFEATLRELREDRTCIRTDA